jgi:two-component system sensor histidine kinase DesK
MEDELPPSIAPLLAKTVLVTVFAGFCVISSVGIVTRQDDTSPIVLSFVYTAALLVLQLAYFSRLNRYRRPSLKYAALLAQAGLVYLPLLQFGDAWGSRPGFLAGSVLLALHPAAAGPLFALIVAGTCLVQGELTGSAEDIAYAAVSTVVTGLVVFGLTRLTNLVTQLHAARGELAQLAVEKERLRFARDLHDLLGMSLSAITLKSELTSRLIPDQPTRASEELAEILVVSRRALADVRSVASGYRRLSLNEECDSAESVLAVADVAVVLRRDYGELPERTGTLLATVLREGVTNVLRHSDAQRCDIRIRQSERSVHLEMVNDGASTEPGRRRDTGGSSGSGLRNLCERVRTVRGTLVAERLPGGRFRLCATIRLAEPREAPDPATTSRNPWRFGLRQLDSVR